MDGYRIKDESPQKPSNHVHFGAFKTGTICLSSKKIICVEMSLVNQIWRLKKKDINYQSVE